MYQPIDALDTIAPTDPSTPQHSTAWEPFKTHTTNTHKIGDTDSGAISPTPPLCSNRLEQRCSSPESQDHQHRLTQTARAIAQHLQGIQQHIDFSQAHWHYLALSTLLLSLPTGISITALQSITSPPTANCNQPQQFRAELAELQCLHRKMDAGDRHALIQALPKLQAWPRDSSVHSVAQRLLKDWSVVALSMAHRDFEAGQWDSAARLIQAIPQELPLGNEAQGKLTLWQQIKEQGDRTYKLALDALGEQDWAGARHHAQTLANLNNDYWQQQGLQALPLQIDEALQAQQSPDGSPDQLSAMTSSDMGLSKHPSRTWISKQPASLSRSPKAMPILISIASLSIAAPSPTKPEFSIT